MAIKPGTYEEKTLLQRKRLQELVASGMSEQEGMLLLFPNDSNRSRRLNTWKSRGLWPIPSDENIPTVIDTTPQEIPTDLPIEDKDETVANLLATSATVLRETIIDVDASASSEITEIVIPSSNKGKGVFEPLPEKIHLAPGSAITNDDVIPTTREDLEQLIKEIIRDQVPTFNAVKRPPGPGRGNRGKSHIKISISLPEHLNTELNKLSGNKSQHVAAAVEIYLGLKEKD